MFKIGDEIELKIEKIVFGGEGLAYYDNMVVFVPMSCIGDVVKARVISMKKTYSRAIITDILVASKDRINKDKYSFIDNNACDFAHIKYEAQLEYKNNMLIELLKSMNNIDISNIYSGILPADRNKNYRNKVAMPFFKENGEIKVGFYERKSHNIFSIKNDILISKIADKTIKILCKQLNKENFTVYNEKKNEGFLKHVVVRNNEKGEVLLAIVINKKTRLKQLCKVLKTIYENNEFIKSVYVSIKHKVNNIILGEENICLYGDKYISESIDNIDFKIYLDSFFQINIEQVKKLYSKALQYISINDEKIIDAYSGTGTIAMLLSKKSKKIYAIESVKSAVLSAKQTACENNIDNVVFVCDKVENYIEKTIKSGKIDAIVFDPPRKGLESNIINIICKNKIEKIIYISCEPSTFARDLKLFTENSYKLKHIAAVDMFPNTHHIEIVAVIEKR